MTATTTEPRKSLSTSERQRQMDESVKQAMALYQRDGDAMRANTARLKALREAHEAAAAAEKAAAAPVKKVRKTAKAS